MQYKNLIKLIVSPVRPIFLFLQASLEVLAVPLSPPFQVLVRSVLFLEPETSHELLGVPDGHIARDLQRIHFEHQRAEPVRQPWLGVPIVVHHHPGLLLGLQVVIQDGGEKGALEEDKDCGRPHLNDGDVDKEHVTDEWHFHVVVNVPHTQELFLRVFLHQLSIYHVLELVDVLSLVREHGLHVGMVATHPPWLPLESNRIVVLDYVLVNVLEMPGIGSVRWDVLDVGFDIVDGCGSILERWEQRLYVNHWVERCLLMLFQCVNPHIDIAIELAHGELAQGSCGFLLVPDPF